MDLTEDEVREILALIENSSFDHLELEVGELKLTVNKGPFVAEHSAAVAAPAPPTPAPGATDAPVARQDAQPGHEAPAAAAGLVPIAAPMVGTFYAASKPGMSAFVEKGARVTPDTTVGLIEVMKVFTGIRAGVDGVIEEIRVSDAEFVEFGQALFLVKPDPDGVEEGAGA
jgi:acetyl-CoA carboxylase biotin carboxyl carrier protein